MSTLDRIRAFEPWRKCENMFCEKKASYGRTYCRKCALSRKNLRNKEW